MDSGLIHFANAPGMTSGEIALDTNYDQQDQRSVVRHLGMGGIGILPPETGWEFSRRVSFRERRWRPTERRITLR